MSGYSGYSKSNNAVDAENNGRYPLTTAIKVLAEKAGITQKAATDIFKKLGTTEYHHASKFYNAVKYYDVEAALEYIHEQNNPEPEEEIDPLEIAENQAYDEKRKHEQTKLRNKKLTCKHDFVILYTYPHHKIYRCVNCGNIIKKYNN
jgi:signal-transduction protein with cAMP-binding, CBS, and nucleotidyltransferase domain